MTVSSLKTVISADGDGSTTEFPYDFKIFADGDLTVILRSAAGTETVQTLTTDYSVTNAGNANGGNVVFVTAPASGVTVLIRRDMDLTQSTDYTPNDPFPATSHEDALDRLTFISQQQQEELDRSIKLSRTNTMTSTEFTVGASDRANKILAFDTSGEISVTQELGTYQGTDATTTTEAYAVRDIIKSTTAGQLNNVYICVATSVAGDLLTDTDHFELLIDAVSAATSATNAASSATTAGDAQTAAETAQGLAETAQGLAETAQGLAGDAQTAAETAQGLAESARDDAQAAETDFRDTYYGSFADDSAAEIYQTGTNGGTVDTGDIYFNTTSNTLKIYNGSTWQDAALTAANFLTVGNNLSDLGNAGTARTNLGLGTIATQASDNVSITGGSVTGITDLTIADGGTGASSASAARTNLGLVIGTDVQAYDADIVAKDTNNTFTKAQIPSTFDDTFANLSSAGVFDFDTYQNFIVELASGSNTLANPTTEASNVGQTGVFIFIQPSSGSAGTLSFDSAGDYETVGGSAIALSSTNSAYDVVPYVIKADNSILLGTPQLGFA
jgi:hypothetical protein